MFIKHLLEILKPKKLEQEKRDLGTRTLNMRIGDSLGMINVVSESPIVWGLVEGEITGTSNARNCEAYYTKEFGLVDANCVDIRTKLMETDAARDELSFAVNEAFGLNDITRPYAKRVVARVNKKRYEGDEGYQVGISAVPGSFGSDGFVYEHYNGVAIKVGEISDHLDKGLKYKVAWEDDDDDEEDDDEDDDKDDDGDDEDGEEDDDDEDEEEDSDNGEDKQENICQVETDTALTNGVNGCTFCGRTTSTSISISITWN